MEEQCYIKIIHILANALFGNIFEDPDLSELEEEAPEHVHSGGDVPIYPSVAKHLQLDFISDTTKYEIITGEGSVYMTFAEYVEHYVEYTRKSMEIMRIW